MTDFFVPGGTMKPGAPSYIPRAADEQLFEAVLRREYCNVLTTRQMGKSSLMARTAVRLKERGVACATVDLQGKGSKFPAEDQWYYSVAKQVADGLGTSSAWTAWWRQQDLLLPAQRLTDFFADIVLKEISGPVAVFIDEVDWMIKLKFSDEFFASIRSCYNRRATDPAFERLTFVLLGSAAPSQLIRDKTRTPFNVGRGIELTDFTPEEARRLLPGLGRDGEAVLARIFYWTDGHPYLTQMLGGKVIERRSPESIDAKVDCVVKDALLSPAARQQENNLKFVGDRLTQGTTDVRTALKTYREVLRDKPVIDIPASAVHTSLRLSGAVKPDADRRLRIRNLIYRQVFNEAWIRDKLPRNNIPIYFAATVGLLAILGAWYFLLFPKPYIEQLKTASNDVPYESYFALNKPFFRDRADELLAQYWERRGDRDRAILVRANSSKQVGLAALIGSDYPALRLTLRHEGNVTSVAFSPDGTLVATGSFDHTARVFEARTGREVLRLAHQGAVDIVAFSPDGTLVATGSVDGTARVFKARTGREVSRLTHQEAVHSVAFSPDGTLVATGSRDHTARVFEVRTGREVSRLAHQGDVVSVAFSPDGTLVATGSRDHTARVFEVRTGREVSRLAHQGDVVSVAFSPDGRLVATGSIDHTARVFEARTGREVLRLAHQGAVDIVAFSPDGTLVATGSVDGTARVFKARTGREVSRLTHQEAVHSVAFSPDGTLVATGSRDHTARVFEVRTGREVSRLAHQGDVVSVAFSPDGRLVATGSIDYTARVFEARTGREVSRLAHQEAVDSVVFSPDGTLVATGSRDHTARVFEARTGREVSRLAHLDGIMSLAFSPDGTLVATGSVDGTARVFEVRTGREVSRLTHQHAVYSVAFSPEGTLVATGSVGGTARVFEARTGREISRFEVSRFYFSFSESQLVDLSVAFSPDGTLVATWSRFPPAQVFEARTGREVSRLTQQDAVHSVAFSPDGTLVATGSEDGTARIFEARTGREISRITSEYIDTVTFSPDGNWLVVAAANWLSLYKHTGGKLRPIANRYAPVIWPATVRFSPPKAQCPRCVDFIRDVPGDPLKIERINFDENPELKPKSNKKQLVAEWSAKLGLAFDLQGRILPSTAGPH